LRQTVKSHFAGAESVCQRSLRPSSTNVSWTTSRARSRSPRIRVAYCKSGSSNRRKRAGRSSAGKGSAARIIICSNAVAHFLLWEFRVCHLLDNRQCFDFPLTAKIIDGCHWPKHGPNPQPLFQDETHSNSPAPKTA